MDRLPEGFVRAVEEGRFQQAAADEPMARRWREDGDHLARALLLLCAAHHDASVGKGEGARHAAGRATRHLEALPLDPYAALLIEHARQLLRALQEGRAAPPLPLGFR